MTPSPYEFLDGVLKCIISGTPKEKVFGWGVLVGILVVMFGAVAGIVALFHL